MGVGLNSALGLVGTMSVAASKVGTAVGQKQNKDGKKEKEPNINTQEMNMLLGNNLFSRDVLRKQSNNSDVPISQANDGQLNLMMANKAMRNMQMNQVAKRISATRKKVKGDRK